MFDEKNLNFLQRCADRFSRSALARGEKLAGRVHVMNPERGHRTLTGVTGPPHLVPLVTVQPFIRTFGRLGLDRGTTDTANFGT